jgi:hypothetical protein
LESVTGFFSGANNRRLKRVNGLLAAVDRGRGVPQLTAVAGGTMLGIDRNIPQQNGGCTLLPLTPHLPNAILKLD